MTEPVFFLATRSFWAAMATGALILEQGEPAVRAIATLVATVFGGDADAMTAWGMDVLPLATLMLAIQQRSGAARPYTVNPKAIR